MLRHKAHGRCIQLFRDARGWTQEQLAHLAGYSIKTIYKAEASGLLKRQTLTDIATALRVELADIIDNPEGLLPTRQEDANKRIVLEMLEVFANQNLKRLMSVVHADAVVESLAPEPIREGGTYCGRNNIRKYFRQALPAIEWPHNKREIECLLADGPFVDLHLHDTEYNPDTGQSITYPVCFHFRIQDGLMVHFREYQDYTPVLAFYEANGWPHWRR